MKKLVSALIAVVTGITMLQLGTVLSYADTSFDDGDFRFTVVSSNSVLVSKYYGSETEIALPASVGDREVSGIYSGCFENSNITSVTIPDSYTVIGSFAFNGCDGLTEVRLPESLETVGMMAFYDCGALQDVDFSAAQSLESIGFAAFSDCTALEEVLMPDSVTEIGENAFCNCSSLSSLTLSKSLYSIPEYAFYGCGLLTAVDIPASVTEIGESAFENCAFTGVFVPETVTEIGDNAFAPDNAILCFEDTAAAEYCRESGSELAVIIEKVPGDVNLDGKTNISDVTALQRYLAEFIDFNAFQTVLADTTCDGEISIDDATLIQMYLAEFDVVLGA